MRTRTETEVPHECDLVDDEGAIVRITEQIDALRPDVVITFGPDGITGHRDHRIVSALMGEDTYRTWWRTEWFRRPTSQEAATCVRCPPFAAALAQ